MFFYVYLLVHLQYEPPSGSPLSLWISTRMSKQPFILFWEVDKSKGNGKQDTWCCETVTFCECIYFIVFILGLGRGSYTFLYNILSFFIPPHSAHLGFSKPPANPLLFPINLPFPFLGWKYPSSFPSCHTGEKLSGVIHLNWWEMRCSVFSFIRWLSRPRGPACLWNGVTGEASCPICQSYVRK